MTEAALLPALGMLARGTALPLLLSDQFSWPILLALFRQNSAIWTLGQFVTKISPEARPPGPAFALGMARPLSPGPGRSGRGCLLRALLRLFLRPSIRRVKGHKGPFPGMTAL